MIRPSRLALIAGIALSAASAQPAGVGAATITVSNTAQLQAAVINAKPGDTIMLSPSTDATGQYQPTSPLELKVNVTLQGSESGSSAIISGSNVLCPCPTQFGSPDTIE